MHIYQRKTVKIGKSIEVTQLLRNDEKISAFDTATISSIGSIMSVGRR